MEIEKEEKADYSTTFATKLKKGETAIQNGETTRLNPDDVWENIL